MRETQTDEAGDGVLEFDLIDRLHKSLRVSGHDAPSLAAVLGVHENTIRNYLSGRTRPSRGMLIAWAFAVDHGITVEWLETGQGVVPNPPADRQEARGPTGVDKLVAEKQARKGHGNRDNRTYDQPLAA